MTVIVTPIVSSTEVLAFPPASLPSVTCTVTSMLATQ